MNKSLKLFSFKGIPVFVHWSFSFIVLYIFYIANRSGLDLISTGWLSFLFAAFFVCVILHEYGHALSARRYGISTRDIILTPIGGIARLTKIPHRPVQELIVALAGPAVNVLIAIPLGIVIFVFSDYFIQFDPIQFGNLDFRSCVIWLFIGNIALAVFNLIPAFPMDGGRVLRSLLAMRTSRINATKWASWIGKLFATAFLMYGMFYGHYMIAFVGLFVFLSAASEYRQMKLEDFLHTNLVQDLFHNEYDRINADVLVRDVTIDPSQKDWLVFNEWNQIVGLLDPQDVVVAKKDQPQAVVDQLAKPTIFPINLSDYVHKAFNLMNTHKVRTLPVYDQERLVGVLHYQDIINRIR